MKPIKDTVRSTVHVGYDGRVSKIYRGTNADERYHNEKRILKYLEHRGCDFVPRVLEFDDAELRLVMSNCGQPVNQLNPEKIQALFAEVESYGVQHTDQALRNITYDGKRGRFCVIDFELAQLSESGELESAWESVSWNGLTDRGRFRKRNDDSFACFAIRGDEGYEPLPSSGEARIENGDVVFLVSDGMGGASSGDVASEMITGRLREIIPRSYWMLANQMNPDRLGLLAQAFEDVHRDVVQLCERNHFFSGMGATLTVLWLTPESAYFGHIGDSRLYLFRDGELRQLSEDHTRAWRDWSAGKLNERQFRDHPRKNVLQQVIGGNVQRIDPQFGSEPVKVGDIFLLCSDGLIGGLWQKQIAEILRTSEKSALEETTQALFQKSLAADGRDNICLVTAMIGK